MIGSFRSSADVFAELNRLQGMLDQAFGLPGRSGIRHQAGAAFPLLNVGTTPDALEIHALAPGLDPATLELTVERGLLTIAGERKSDLPEEGERTSIYARERFAGRFRRTISLPEDADAAQVQASYRDGVLRVRVAKREASRPRRIDVQ